MTNFKYSFPPIIDKNSTILILGTLPGEESLAKNEYYAHRSNQFWKILYAVFGKTEIDIEYEKKKKFLLDNRLALWDVYYCGEREGSSDLKIKNGRPNDIKNLLKTYPKINRIVFDSKTAEKAYRNFFANINIDTTYVPSPSSAYPKPLNEKIELWKKAFLQN